MILLIKYLITFIITFQIYSYEVCHADFGLVTQTQIQLFSNKTVYFTKDVQLKKITTFLYDPIEKDIYISNIEEKIGSIFRIKTSGATAFNVTPIVERAGFMKGMAFDHPNSTLYWIADDSIFFAQVPDDEIKTLPSGQLFLKFNRYNVRIITIDVNGRYLYWVNPRSEKLRATIERIHLETSDKGVFLRNVTDPLCIMVDSGNNTLYWIDGVTPDSRGIHRKDLVNVSALTQSYFPKKTPYIIALDDKNVYWAHWLWDELWMIPKKSFGRDNSPVLVSKIDFNQCPKSNIDWIQYPIGLFILSGNDEVGKETDENKEKKPKTCCFS